MIKKHNETNYINIFIALFLIASIAQSYNYSIFFIYFNTYIRFILNYVFGLTIFYFIIKNFNERNFVINNSKKIFYFLLIYFSIYILFAIINSEDYWDYKYLFEHYIPWIFTFFAIFLGLNFKEHLKEFKKIFLILFFSFFILFFENGDEAFVRIFASLYFFLFLANYLSFRYKILIIILSVIILFSDVGTWRTNQLRLFYFLLLFFFNFLILSFPNLLIRIYSIFLLFVPIIILVSFVFFDFDFFVYLTTLDLKFITTENTRTFILNDILEHYNHTNSSYLFGSGGQSYFFTNFMQDSMTHYNKIARYAVESGFMNLFLKNGLFGIFLLLIINFLSIKNCLTLSKNTFSKKLALAISFGWIIFFIEIPMTLQISSFLFFYLIGIGLSKDFLEMKDDEIKELLNK